MAEGKDRVAQDAAAKAFEVAAAGDQLSGIAGCVREALPAARLAALDQAVDAVFGDGKLHLLKGQPAQHLVFQAVAVPVAVWLPHVGCAVLVHRHDMAGLFCHLDGPIEQLPQPHAVGRRQVGVADAEGKDGAEERGGCCQLHALDFKTGEKGEVGRIGQDFVGDLPVVHVRCRSSHSQFMGPLCCCFGIGSYTSFDVRIRHKDTPNNHRLRAGGAQQRHLVGVGVQDGDQPRLPAPQQVQVGGDAADNVRPEDGAASLREPVKVWRRVAVAHPAVVYGKRPDAQPKVQVRVGGCPNRLPALDRCPRLHGSLPELCVEGLAPFVAEQHHPAVARVILLHPQHRAVLDGVHRRTRRRRQVHPLVPQQRHAVDQKLAMFGRVIAKALYDTVGLCKWGIAEHSGTPGAICESTSTYT